ncbi:hypothetical protein ScalyP_jg4192 [Parmales sp. scaly parma]|nr:hypothetical protein ScalyP_jg4192 [Parmales sp. scaly parma]
MPTPVEVDTGIEIAKLEAERVAKKVALQKANAAPINFKESMANEKAKKAKINGRTKQEEKEALCEVLGRGC